ncbi:unnamed protein product [Taenia asiatica]|uniref:Aa_trans domain-containing protein n=1 Tax=Taenia asiatica TaxID=60517 RepID=A0A0R3W3N4_TAEAS|nr:unnamed protein product [Taenia asiatica]
MPRTKPEGSGLQVDAALARPTCAGAAWNSQRRRLPPPGLQVAGLQAHTTTPSRLPATKRLNKHPTYSASTTRALYLSCSSQVYGCISAPVNCALVYTIFVLLILEFRIKAPGAQAIAQFVGRRFGKVAHILTITLSLLTGLYTLSLNVIVGSKILDAVTQDVSKTAIVSVVFILVGAMAAVARCRSHSLILYIIITNILLICAFLVINVLNVPTYTPFCSVDILYKLLTCYSKSNYEIGISMIGGFDGGHLNKILIKLIPKFAHPYHLLIARTLDVAFAIHLGVDYKNN